ncbi:ras-related protein Rab-10-like isoform 2-T2 [Vipera latastei]
MAEGTGCEAPKACLAKIVMVGDSFVGKTSVLRRYTDLCPAARGLPPSYITTVGIDFKVKTISCDNTTMKLQIWDTAGQERFHTFTTNFFRGAHGFVLVYDITDAKSFQGISHWMKDIYEKVGENTDIILLGNKCDKEAERVISKNRGEKNSCVFLDLDVVDLNEKLQTRSCCKL